MAQQYVQGLEGVKEALSSIPPKLRRQALRNALAAGARVVRDEARRNRRQASGEAIATGRKTILFNRLRYFPGSVEKAISVRTSKQARQQGDVGVFVNVKPMRGARLKGKGFIDPRDPYYWRFLEFGAPRINVRARQFLRPAANGGALDRALQVFVEKIGPQIQKLDTNPRDPL